MCFNRIIFAPIIITTNFNLNQVNRLDQLFYFGVDQIEEDILLARIRAFDYLLFDAQNESLSDYRIEFDDRHRATCFTHVDEQGEPSVSHFGYVSAQCQYVTDRRGRVRTVTLNYQDADRQPCLDRFGHSHTTYSLDTKRRVTQIDWREADGYGHSHDHVSRLLLEWDEEILRVTYLDNHGLYATRYQYVFDESRQFIRLRMGVDESGMLTTDDDGGNGSWIERDPVSHRPVALWNINISRQRIQAVDGVAYWRLTFQEKGVQRLMYFNANGVAMTNHEGAFGFETEFDVYGNLKRETNLDAAGNPMPNKYGIVTFEFQHDELGRTTEVHAWGAKGEPVANPEGVHAVRQSYDDTTGNRSMLVRKFDVKGNLILGTAHAPYITRYLSTRETLQYSINEDGSVAPNSQGHLVIVHRVFDDFGRPLIEENLQPDGVTRVAPQADLCGYSYEYDDRHRIIKNRLLNEHGGMLADEIGVAVYVTQLDRWGRQIRQSGLDLKGELVENSLGDFGTGFEYDDEGNITWVSLGQDGRPHANLKGYTYYLLEKDSQGRDVRELWYDAQRKPYVSVNGDSGLMTVYRPHVKEIIFLDANGDPHDNLNGFAIIHYEYDEQEREVYVVRYNMDGDKVQVPEGYCALRTEYHSDQLHHRTLVCLDEDDNPVNSLRGCAFLEQWLNDEGQMVRELRFDSDHLPAVDEDGVCGNTFRNLPAVEAFGRSELVGQLDADGKFVADDTGLVYWQVDTDALGRVVRKRWFDINEEPCRDGSGAYGIEFKYEENDTEGIRPREERFLSRKGRLMNNRWGYAAVLIIYDVELREQRIYFDKSGKFVHPSHTDEDDLD